MTTQRKVAVMISGGLDSMLAAKALMEQGLHVEGLAFFTGFCTNALKVVSGRELNPMVNNHNAFWVAEQLGIKLNVKDIHEEYKDILLNPKHGYGANLNPCLDCKISMVSHAYQWIQENDFDFIATGEVVGQRPKSQRKTALPIISEESGAGDLVLRPLSAQLLKETLPEREGWVDREKLYDFSGRSRKPQLALAKAFGFEEFSQPAGGCCLLTDESFSERLSDMWKHNGSKDYELDDVMLLSVGRHLRPRDGMKVIVSRNESETNLLQGYRKKFIYIKTVSHSGPITLLEGSDIADADIEQAARIAARFSQGRDAETVSVSIGRFDQEPTEIEVAPMRVEDVSPDWYV